MVNNKKSDKEDVVDAILEQAEAVQPSEPQPSENEPTPDSPLPETGEADESDPGPHDPDAQDAEPLPETRTEEQVELEAEIVQTEDASEDENIADDTDRTDPEDGESDTADDAEEPIAEPEPEELIAEPDPEPQVQQSAPAPAPEPQKTAGVGTMLAGGLVAGAVGYLLASASLLPAPWKAADPAIAELQTRIDAQSATLSESIEELRGLSQPADLSTLESGIAGMTERLDAVDSRLAEVDSAIAGLGERVEAIEARPVAETGAVAPAPDMSAYEAQLAALEQTVQAQRAEVEAMIAEARELDEQAAEAQRRAAIQAGVARLQAALEQGTPFQSIVDELAAAGADVPGSLASAAGDGVATLSALRSAYPDAARTALAEVREGENTAGSVTAFLQRQLGARSVEPREGDDPDAILSRVEARLSSGDLGAALQEIDTLPEAAQTALSDWTALARQRLTAQEAIDELASGAAEN